jgi:hypothetical protein
VVDFARQRTDIRHQTHRPQPCHPRRYHDELQA